LTSASAESLVTPEAAGTVLFWNSRNTLLEKFQIRLQRDSKPKTPHAATETETPRNPALGPDFAWCEVGEAVENPPRRARFEMKAIEILMNEHRTIERALDVMEAWVGRIRCQPDDLEEQELGRFVAFLRDFVDERHHGKEEDILFAAMVEHGIVRTHGPIALMLHEHDLGRSLVDSLAHLAQQPTPWNDQERQHLDRTVRTYAKLLREHIRKEDKILYPLARRRLPGPVMREISMRVLGECLFEELNLPNLSLPRERST